MEKQMITEVNENVKKNNLLKYFALAGCCLLMLFFGGITGAFIMRPTIQSTEKSNNQLPANNNTSINKIMVLKIKHHRHVIMLMMIR